MELWELHENGEVSGLLWDRGEMSRAFVGAEKWKRPAELGTMAVVTRLSPQDTSPLKVALGSRRRSTRASQGPVHSRQTALRACSCQARSRLLEEGSRKDGVTTGRQTWCFIEQSEGPTGNTGPMTLRDRLI